MKRRIGIPLAGLGIVAGLSAVARKVLNVRSIDDLKQVAVDLLDGDASPSGEEGQGPEDQPKPKEVRETKETAATSGPEDASEGLQERRSEPDPIALKRMTQGEAAKLGMDIEKLKEMGASFQPLIEYLTYIQVQRGDNESLVFVRGKDVDALAELVEADPGAFVEELQKLGVMLSMN